MAGFRVVLSSILTGVLLVVMSLSNGLSCSNVPVGEGTSEESIVQIIPGEKKVQDDSGNGQEHGTDHDHHESHPEKPIRNCVPGECETPPASKCLSAKKLRVFQGKGSCHPVEDQCVFSYTDKDCPNVCKNGRCLSSSDPCASVTCDQPPKAKCSSSKLVRYTLPGTCKNGTCSYQQTEQACSHGCKDGKCNPDPCAGVSCKNPPVSKCLNSTTLQNYYSPGSCKAGVCSYPSAKQTCPYGCSKGACRVGTGFSAITPFRFLDSRGQTKPKAGSTTCLAIAGKGGVPSSAKSVYVNLVAVVPVAPGFLTAFPKGISRPNVSNLNYTTGQTIANGAIVKLGSGGQVCVYTLTETDIIVDVYGYFGDRSDYFPVGPTRRLDTRSGSPIGTQKTGCYKIAGQGGVPSKATAIALNITAVSAKGPGYLTVYPKGISRPNTSTLNYGLGQTIANGAIVKPGANGEVCVYSFATTHLVLDVMGYFGTSSNYVPMAPKRLYDSRSGAQPGNDKTYCLKIAGSHSIPSSISGLALNVTAISPAGLGFLTVYTEGTSRPITSSLNYQQGQSIGNNILVRPGSTGKVCIFNKTATHFAVDIVGYFSALGSGNPCTGVTCNQPPPSVCVGGGAVVSYAAKGSCKNGLCVYPMTSKPCSWGCANATCKPQPPAPKYTFHPVTTWQLSSQPVSSGARMDLKALRYITIHYPGGTVDVDGRDNIYQDSDFVQVLRNMQSDYVRNRGYSLGYNSAVAPDGDEWEIRGTRFRAASNGCSSVNKPAYTIQVTTPNIHASPSSAQVKGVQQAIARVRAAAKAAGNTHKLTINGHRDVRPLCGSGGTACPGTPLYNLIKNGTFK